MSHLEYITHYHRRYDLKNKFSHGELGIMKIVEMLSPYSECAISFILLARDLDCVLKKTRSYSDY